MSFMLKPKEGEYLVALARRAIETRLEGKEDLIIENPPEITKKHAGVFVTLNIHHPHRLRGCIGYPYPTQPLVEATANAAVSSALSDPRFPMVTLEEMEEIVVEVSVLTPPQRIKVCTPEEYTEQVKVGYDGIIIERGIRKGLLLPQVAVDWEWDSEEFLSQGCIKAGLPPDAWLIEGTDVYKFQAIIFSELTPRGHIKRITIGG